MLVRLVVFLLVVFSAMPLYAQMRYPLDDGVPLEQFLDAYFHIMYETNLPGEPSFRHSSLLDIRKKTRAFWKINIHDDTLPSMKSNMFFSIYQPVSWEINKISDQKTSTIVSVKMIVGSPAQLELDNREMLVHYELEQIEGNWYLVGFKEIGKVIQKALLP